MHFGHYCQQNLSSGFLLSQKFEIIDFFSEYGRYLLFAISPTFIVTNIDLENPSWVIREQSLFATNVDYAQLCCHIPDT